MLGDTFRLRVSIVVAALFSVLMLTAAEAQTVKIGVITSYSGFIAQAGDEMEKGIDLYVKQHEKELPAGRQDRAHHARRHRPQPRSASGSRRS